MAQLRSTRLQAARLWCCMQRTSCRQGAMQIRRACRRARLFSWNHLPGFEQRGISDILASKEALRSLFMQ